MGHTIPPATKRSSSLTAIPAAPKLFDSPSATTVSKSNTSAVLVLKLRFPVAWTISQEIEEMPDPAVEIAGAEEVMGNACD